MPDTNGSNRLDRIENALALLVDDHVQFREEHKQLLTAQVVLTDRVERIAKSVAELTEAQKQLTEGQKHTDQRLNALIAVVDDIVRHRPPQ